MTEVEQDANRQCVLCGSRDFVASATRVDVLKCARCRSFPRTRMLGMALMRGAPPANHLPVIHFAPETALGHVVRARYGNSWTPADIEPARYQAKIGKPVMYADLTEPSRYFTASSVRGFIHSHVLEHVAADIGSVIREMNDAVAPGGFHAFLVPIRGDRYEEDLDMSKPDAYRLKRFGHVGHVRNFGRLDFEESVLSHFRDWRRVDLASLIGGDELLSAAMPGPDLLSRFTGSTAFLYVKSA